MNADASVLRHLFSDPERGLCRHEGVGSIPSGSANVRGRTTEDGGRRFSEAANSDETKSLKIAVEREGGSPGARTRSSKRGGRRTEGSHLSSVVCRPFSDLDIVKRKRIRSRTG